MRGASLLVHPFVLRGLSVWKEEVCPNLDISYSWMATHWAVDLWPYCSRCCCCRNISWTYHIYSWQLKLISFYQPIQSDDFSLLDWWTRCVTAGWNSFRWMNATPSWEHLHVFHEGRQSHSFGQVLMVWWQRAHTNNVQTICVTPAEQAVAGFFFSSWASRSDHGMQFGEGPRQQAVCVGLFVLSGIKAFINWYICYNVCFWHKKIIAVNLNNTWNHG